MAYCGKALVFMTALGAALGCGGRTETLFDDGTGGGSFGGANAGGQANGGSNPTAGHPGVAGTSFGGFNQGGASLGGVGNVGGTLSTGGFGANPGGAGPTGGALNGGFGGVGVGGVSPVGGAPNGGITSGGSPNGGFGAVAGTGGIVDLCVGSADNACDQCLCKSCGSELTACFTDVGCALILACFEQTQCQGFGCYQNSTCRKVINQFGGLTGGPVSEVFSLVSCSVTTRPSCGCN